jgi:hypothetical protein
MYFKNELKNAALAMSDIFDSEVEMDTTIYILDGRMVAIDEDSAEEAGGAIRKTTFCRYAEAFYRKYGRAPEMEYAGDGVAYAG